MDPVADAGAKIMLAAQSPCSAAKVPEVTPEDQIPPMHAVPAHAPVLAAVVAASAATAEAGHSAAAAAPQPPPPPPRTAADDLSPEEKEHLLQAMLSSNNHHVETALRDGVEAVMAQRVPGLKAAEAEVHQKTARAHQFISHASQVCCSAHGAPAGIQLCCNLAQAQKRLLVGGASSAAAAQGIVERTMKICPRLSCAIPVLKAADGAVRDVIVLLCSSNMPIKDNVGDSYESKIKRAREVFDANVDEAYGFTVGTTLRAKLLLAYHKDGTNKAKGFPSINYLGKLKRGCPRPPRKRVAPSSQPPCTPATPWNINPPHVLRGAAGLQARVPPPGLQGSGYISGAAAATTNASAPVGEDTPLSNFPAMLPLPGEEKTDDDDDDDDDGLWGILGGDFGEETQEETFVSRGACPADCDSAVVAAQPPKSHAQDPSPPVSLAELVSTYRGACPADSDSAVVAAPPPKSRPQDPPPPVSLAELLSKYPCHGHDHGNDNAHHHQQFAAASAAWMIPHVFMYDDWCYYNGGVYNHSQMPSHFAAPYQQGFPNPMMMYTAREMMSMYGTTGGTSASSSSGRQYQEV